MMVSVAPIPSHRLRNSTRFRPPWCLALYSRREIFHNIFLLSTTTMLPLKTSSNYNHGDDACVYDVETQTTPKQHPCTLHVRGSWSRTGGHPKNKTTPVTISIPPHHTAPRPETSHAVEILRTIQTPRIHPSTSTTTSAAKTTPKIKVKGPPEHAPRRSATRTPCELC